MKRELRWFALPLLLPFGFAHAQPGKVTYVYTDPQGTPLAEADANGNITATFDYRPYGAQALGTPKDGPGYTGHVNDVDSGLVYMQARYYDPAMGRFLSVDPMPPSPGQLFGFGRYAYANGNPVVNIDPDGRECIRTGNQVTCNPHVNGLPPITFPAPKGWPKTIQSGDWGYHEYNKPLAGNSGSGNQASAIADAITKSPTPGDTNQATEDGVRNDASPRSGSSFLQAMGKAKPSPVMTYLRKDANGNSVTVNVTLPGHPLFPGYVERGVTTVQVNGHNYAIINNAGEGLGLLQSKVSPFANLINNVWIQNSADILQAVRNP